MIKVNIANIIGRGYKEIWNSKKRYVVTKGSRASKKSKTTALWLIYHIMKYPLAHALVVRQFFNTLKDSCFQELLWAIRTLQVSHLWKYTTSPLELVYKPTGQKILFRGFDNPDSITSITVSFGFICFCWLEESYQIKSEAEFNKLDFSLRGALPDGYFRQFRFTMNPWSTKTWIKARFFDSPDANTHSTTTNYMCNEFLDATDYALFEDLKARSMRRYLVEGLGEWGISEGLVYENWVESDFDIEQLKKRDNIVSAFGLDFGYSVDPAGFIACLVDNTAKEIYIYDEIYKKGLTNTELYHEIAYRGYNKEKIIADSSEPKSIEELKRLGLRRINSAIKGPDSVNYGIQLLQGYKIYVHPRCTNVTVELLNYVWDTKNNALINKPVDDYNHLLDALRYTVTATVRGSKLDVCKNFL